MHGSAFDYLGFTTLTHFRGPIPTKIPDGVYLTRYLVHHSGLINAAPAADPTMHANATFAEVPASPGA